MATYSELQAQVERLVIDLPQAVLSAVPDLVRLAHREAQRRHNFFLMEAVTAEISTTAFTRVLAARPADWKEARGDPWYREDTGNARKVLWAPDREELVREFGLDPDLDFGEPRYLLLGEATDVLGAQNIEVWPFPDGISDHADGEYRIIIPYWKYLPSLTTDAQQDWITNNGEEFIVFRAAAEGFFMDWDEERGTLWLQRAGERFAELRRLDKARVLAQMGDTMAVHRHGVFEPGLRR